MDTMERRQSPDEGRRVGKLRQNYGNAVGGQEPERQQQQQQRQQHQERPVGEGGAPEKHTEHSTNALPASSPAAQQRGTSGPLPTIQESDAADAVQPGSNSDHGGSRVAPNQAVHTQHGAEATPGVVSPQAQGHNAQPAESAQAGDKALLGEQQHQQQRHHQHAPQPRAREQQEKQAQQPRAQTEGQTSSHVAMPAEEEAGAQGQSGPESAQTTMASAKGPSSASAQTKMPASEAAEMPLTFFAGRSAPTTPRASSHAINTMRSPPPQALPAAPKQQQQSGRARRASAPAGEGGSPTLKFHVGMTAPQQNEQSNAGNTASTDEPSSQSPSHQQQRQRAGASSVASCPATPAGGPPSASRSMISRHRSAAQLRADNLADPRNEAQDTIVSRRGTVVGKRGSIADLRKRFADRTRSAPATPSGRTSFKATTGDNASTRRDAVVTPKGVVGRFRNFFLKKAKETEEKSLAAILEEKEAAEAEKCGGKIVIYTTSVSTVKETFWNCQQLLKILHGLLVQYEERDVTLSKDLQRELNERMPGASVPQVFLDGKHLGGLEEVHHMNENDELQAKFARVPRRKKEKVYHCEVCADRRFVLCTWCGGDKKSMMSRFGTELVKLKCTACNENGLMKCPACVYGVGSESSA